MNNKKRVKVPVSKGQSFAEILKFVLRALFFALILVNLVKIWNVLSNAFTWCTKTDFGYVWVINIAIGAIAVWLIGRITRGNRRKYAATIKKVKICVFGIVIFFFECFVWHLSDSWEIITAPMNITNKSLITLGLAATTLSFVWYLYRMNYNYNEYEKKPPQVAKKPNEGADDGLKLENEFDWGGKGSAK